jgi:HD-GYP domain-containing protein (c-di-GMP phosphodiesterase class II)
MHLNRMAQFSRLIAKAIAEQYQFSDETIEHIYLFSPLHDIGKIGIPDRILLKQGRLDAEEYNLMKEHVNKGVHIISQVLEDYQLSHLSDSKVMLNIVAYHHEFLDGSGYPNGLTGDDIPIEARITTVADIFDALTSKRPYKTPWSIDDAFAELTAMAGAGKLDKGCVEALITSREEVTYIVTNFRDKG